MRKIAKGEVQLLLGMGPAPATVQGPGNIRYDNWLIFPAATDIEISGAAISFTFDGEQKHSSLPFFVAEAPIDPDSN